MKYYCFLLLSISCLSTSWAQDSIRVFNSDGVQKNLEDIVQAAKGKKYMFFGELHGQKESHQAELWLLKQLFEYFGDKLVLGMEMFESDVQPIVDEYFDEIINERSFELEARIWDNYKDYKPIVQFAKEKHIPLIATNIPRRYANAVYHKGVDVLKTVPKYGKQFFPKLPMQIDTTLHSYQELLSMISGHQGQNMLYSQALKDATMAHNILKNTKKDKVILHLNGAYHTANREGIISFMKKVPKEDILTITTIFDDTRADESEGFWKSADFNILSKKQEINKQ